jgi:hypothetical protein
LKTPRIYYSRSTATDGISRLVILLMLLIFNISCSKDDFNPDLDESPAWEPEIAFPLAYTEIGISDLAQANDSSTTIIIGNDQFCTLVYHDKVFELNAEQLVQIPDQSFQSQFYLDNGQILTLINSGQVQVSRTQEINFSVSQGMEADSMILKNSQLVINCLSEFPSDASIRITIPGLVKNGITFTEIIPLNNTGSGTTTSMTSFPMHDYHMDLTKNGITTNTLVVNYTIKINGNGANTTTTQSIQCDAVFQSLKFQSLYGYIGQQSIINIPDSVELSIFNNASGTGNFAIAQPKIRFDIANSLGIPFHARISQLTAMNSNQTSFTVATGIPDPLPVNSPTINQIGQTQYSNFTLDHTNSNIQSLIAEQPGHLIAQTQVTTNPNGPAANFITDSSNLSINIHAELPLYGTASDFKIKDTVPFHYNDLANVENMLLRLNIENWFPIEAGLQLIFIDDNYLPLDTIFLNGEVVIPSGIIAGNSDRVSIAGKKIQDHLFDSARINKILNAKNIVVVATASTYQQGNTNVKIFSDYKLKIKIGAIVKMKIQ